MIMEAKDLKTEYLNGNPKVEMFNNMANFMKFCEINKLTDENSITFFDDEKMVMYISRIY